MQGCLQYERFSCSMSSKTYRRPLIIGLYNGSGGALQSQWNSMGDAGTISMTKCFLSYSCFGKGYNSNISSAKLSQAFHRYLIDESKDFATTVAWPERSCEEHINNCQQAMFDGKKVG
jgi:hypothetical protein